MRNRNISFYYKINFKVNSFCIVIIYFIFDFIKKRIGELNLSRTKAPWFTIGNLYPENYKLSAN